MMEKWADFKDRCITRKNLSIQFIESENEYEIWACEAGEKYQCSVGKDSPRPSDQADFEDNYKLISNYAIGERQYPFASGDFDYLGDAVSGECAAGGSLSIDYEFSEQLYISGGNLILSDSVPGDWVEVNVVHPVYGIVKTYIKKRFVPASPGGHPSQHLEMSTPYAGKMPAGLKLRLTYHSSGSSPVKIFFNLYLHRAI